MICYIMFGIAVLAYVMFIVARIMGEHEKNMKRKYPLIKLR